MLTKHFDTLPDAEAQRLIAHLQTAVEDGDAERVAELFRTPGFPATLRARVGSGRTEDGSKNELRLLFEQAMVLAGDNAGPDAWLWIAAATAYRDMDLAEMLKLNRRAAGYTNGELERRLVTLIGQHNEAALRANMWRYRNEPQSCDAAVVLNLGIAALMDRVPKLLECETGRKLRVKAAYGVIIHQQWSGIELDYAEEYGKVANLARELEQWDVVTAGYREIGKILTENGEIDEARNAFEKAIAVADEHVYTWHRDQAQTELDKLDS
jgi:tetratricopeptide (TPR) repeat protein